MDEEKKRCPCCHVLLFLSVFGTHVWKGEQVPYAQCPPCRKKHADVQKRRRKRPEVRAAEKEYKQSPAAKASQRQAEKRFYKTTLGKACRKRKNNTPSAKAANRKWRQSPAGKAMDKRSHQQPAYKAAANERKQKRLACPGAAPNTECPFGHQVNPRCDTKTWYDGLCCACFCASHPDDPRAVNSKKYMHFKEQTVRAFLEATFPSVKWVMDRTVEGTRRRPDHRPLIHGIGVHSHDIIIETDENSHWFYLCRDERKKEDEVHFWVNGRQRPLIWIRFNPDAYDDPATGERIKSCFGVDSLGQCRVKPSKPAEWAARLEKLRQVVAEFMVDHTAAWKALKEEDQPPKDLFLPIELFYDDVLKKSSAAAAAFKGIKAAAKAGKGKAAAPAAAPSAAASSSSALCSDSDSD